ncbi:hypothetical protein [Paenibacillus antarcticus]|uniref:Helix-turn-helix domain containing protein n=1 Tax=Paenibacillus antarcticus TaxID=253703 RepID=A0A162QH18_9BACL|nr:hypothetical protein [Paenibacillus antarcticus]OAB48490.1 hypothetical protein PBAT_02325 [Paenibacillus antarcticus]
MGARNQAIINPLNAKSRRKIHLACEEMDFTWCDDEVKKFEDMWLQGEGIGEIAGELERDPDEVLILLIDRARNNKLIIKRPNGLMGLPI